MVATRHICVKIRGTITVNVGDVNFKTINLIIFTFLTIIVFIECVYFKLDLETETGQCDYKHRIPFPFTVGGKHYFFVLTDKIGGRHWFIQELITGDKQYCLFRNLSLVVKWVKKPTTEIGR